MHFVLLDLSHKKLLLLISHLVFSFYSVISGGEQVGACRWRLQQPISSPGTASASAAAAPATLGSEPAAAAAAPAPAPATDVGGSRVWSAATAASECAPRRSVFQSPEPSRPLPAGWGDAGSDTSSSVLSGMAQCLRAK